MEMNFLNSLGYLIGKYIKDYIMMMGRHTPSSHNLSIRSCKPIEGNHSSNFSRLLQMKSCNICMLTIPLPAYNTWEITMSITNAS